MPKTKTVNYQISGFAHSHKCRCELCHYSPKRKPNPERFAMAQVAIKFYNQTGKMPQVI